MADNIHIPIFIIVHDRVNCLKKSVASFKENINSPTVIIFHDVASTFPECISYLQEMKDKGHIIYRSDVNRHTTVMNSVKDYMKKHPECEYFVLTDPDVELNNSRKDILEFYIHLSKAHNNKRVIGPMLKIDDIPNYYPYKAKVVKSHTAQFWHMKPTPWTQFKDDSFNIQLSLIDTTFQLVHRSLINKPFPRAGIRTYAPYDARHLDWYLNPSKLTPDQKYYSKQAKKNIAHWGVNLV